MRFAKEIGRALSAAAIGDVLQPDAAAQREELHGQMLRRADAGGAVGHRLGSCARGGDKVGGRLHGMAGIGGKDEGILRQHADEGEAVQRIERQRLVDCGIDGVAADDEQQRVAIGHGAGYLRRGGGAAGARPRLHHNVLPEPRR